MSEIRSCKIRLRIFVKLTCANIKINVNYSIPFPLQEGR